MEKIMRKNKITIWVILFTIAISTMACSIISSDDAIATQVADALNEALEETAAAEVAPTYTPYPTYTPVPTYTTQPYFNNYDYNYLPPNNQPGNPPGGSFPNNQMPPMPRR